MPNGKRAGEKCIHLSESNLCSIFNDPSRPNVCGSFQANIDICGKDREEAVSLIRWFEKQTNPITA